MEISLAWPYQRLKFAREKAGFRTAKAFYVKFGINQATYSLHETGQRDIRANTAANYAKALGNCSAAWILTGDGDGPDDRPEDDAFVRMSLQLPQRLYGLLVVESNGKGFKVEDEIVGRLLHSFAPNEYAELLRQHQTRLDEAEERLAASEAKTAAAEAEMKELWAEIQNKLLRPEDEEKH